MQRLDYIFTFNRIPYADDNRETEEIDSIVCKSCDLFIPKKSGISHLPDECDLSDHYGIETVIEIPID